MPPLFNFSRVSMENSDGITIIFNFIRDSMEFSDGTPSAPALRYCSMDGPFTSPPLFTFIRVSMENSDGITTIFLTL